MYKKSKGYYKRLKYIDIQNKVILFLCREDEIERERAGYYSAFSKMGYEVKCTGVINYLGKYIIDLNRDIIAVVQPEGYTSIHPFDILDINIPTISFQWDTYTRTSIRARASMPYDIKIVCHPGYKDKFEKEGCRNTFLLPHCVDDGLVKNSVTTELRYDIGWVGRSDAHFYNLRREVLATLLSLNLKLNDVYQHYSWTEMIGVYKQSKIVINISRDDFLQDANLRCFEAIGSGALLITKLPTELSVLGFIEGKHFIGFTDTQSLKNLIGYYLHNESERINIAMRGQQLVLLKHTYLERANELIKIISSSGHTAMLENPLRREKKYRKLEAIAYSYYKDSELQKMFECLFLAHKRPSLKVIMLVIRLFLVKLKKVL